jgi:acetolactate decarboxylase
MLRRLLHISFLVLIAGPTAAAAAPKIDVHTIGTLRSIIHEGRIEALAPIAKIVARPHAYGLGALARLDGEFIVLDGKIWTSRPGDGDAIRHPSGLVDRDSVTLAVYSNVSSWRSIPVTKPIPLSAIGDMIASRATAAGLPSGGPFAFLIEGPVDSVQWHVADGRELPPGPSSHEAHAAASVQGIRSATNVILLGFYSDHHQGVFTHHDSSVHIHAYFPGDGLVGHVDGVIVKPGATLKLPSPR